MNLVGGYESSDDDDDEQLQPPPPPQQPPQQQSEGVLKQKEKARAVGSVVIPATTKAASNKGKKRRSSKKTTNSKKKKSKKTVNALVLSPEIQAALARGDSLRDSDSDDEDGVAKKPKIVRRPAGSDPSDLLSLLPQPSTATSADDILLKSQKKRDDARTAKSAAAAAAAAAATTVAAAAAATATRAAAAGGGGGIQGQAEEDQEFESDEDGDDLLPGMHAKSAAAAAAASETGSKSGPLFTLPSRARPPPAAAPADPPEEGMGELVRPSGEDTAAVPRHLETGTPGPSAGQQQWGGFDRGHAAAFPQGYAGAGGYRGAAGEVGGVAAAGTSATNYAIYGAASQQQQQQQTAYYHPNAAGAAAGSYQPEFGDGGAKATRRKGRDMERALARGDLGALGSEMPVMDLEQGSNEYNPLRTKPTTAAMNQEQKHIESSVYDPGTGKTVKTLEPTSMQKRKHQINQLAAQAASMERDLMERSGASRLTKAQTHAKYGW